MRNLKLTIEYDGTEYSGWQKQPSLKRKKNTIQQTIEQVLHEILQEEVKLIGSGRTDAGVHAFAQVANFKTTKKIGLFRLQQSLNALLPDDIVVKDVQEVDLDFHARFNAYSRSYTYIINTSSQHMPFCAPWSYWCTHPIDWDAVSQAMTFLIGEHDFASFQANGCQSPHARRQISDFHLAQSGPFVYLNVTANAFVYRMVRKMVGALLQVGFKKQSPDWIQSLLKSEMRDLTPPIAARGLHLTHVGYTHGVVPEWAQYFNDL